MHNCKFLGEGWGYNLSEEISSSKTTEKDEKQPRRVVQLNEAQLNFAGHGLTLKWCCYWKLA